MKKRNKEKGEQGGNGDAKDRGSTKQRESHNPLVRFSSHSRPPYRQEKAVDHTQGSCSGCIRQMAGKERRWRRKEGWGLVFLCCS